MNYLLKMQPSPSGIVESLLNNCNSIKYAKYCFCGNCLRSHRFCRNNVPLRKNSNYVSALNVKLDKKRISENVPKRTVNAKKLTEMLKVMPPKVSTKKLSVYKKRASEYGSFGWKSKYSNDCTKSYDPNVMDFNPELERAKFIHQDLDYLKNKKKQKIFHRKFDNCNSSPTSLYESEKKVATQEKAVIEKTFNYPSRSIANPEPEPQKVDLKKLSSDLKPYDKATDYSKLVFLYSSLDICLTKGMLKEACDFLQKYRKRVLTEQVLVKNYQIVSDIYNSLLCALSCKGYWFILKSVIDWMEEDGVEANCETFAAKLHCLAKLRGPENEKFVLEEVSKVLNSIFLKNISLNDIFCKTSLTKDITENILSIVREVVPSFEIKPDIMELSSDCVLLKKLHTGPNNLQPQVDNMENEYLQSLVEEQLLVEKNLFLSVKAVSSGHRFEVSPEQKKKIEILKERWRAALTRAVGNLQQQQNLKRGGSEFYDLSLYINSLPKDKIVDVLMEKTEHLVQYSGGFGPASEYFYKTIGFKIFQCYQLEKKHETGFTDKTRKLFNKYLSWCAKPSGPAMNSRQKWQMIIQDSEKFTQLDAHVVKWPDEIFRKLGKLLLNIIIREIQFDVRTKSGKKTLPVLYTVLRFRDKAFHEEIQCHPMVTSLFDSVGFDVLQFSSDEIPMLCPPKPWKSPWHGGYLILSSDFLRKPGGITGKRLRLEDVPVQQLYATFDSLNALQSVPWRINKDVLDVALEVFRTGGSEKLSVPKLPEKLPPREKFDEKLSSHELRSKYEERSKLARNLANNYALWCEALYRLSLANHYRDKTFWLPQNCDFRGRVYPIPPLVNHLGSDLFRSLMVFAIGKPLGPKGLDWLKIHLINLTGTQKRETIQKRLDFANEILPVILDSAEKPLTGEKWWMESEEPWQTLAACMELKKAISSPNPESYVCGYPIHQDGSCNGLQHYAALGKDLIGAQSVNLVPCDEPQDVYGVVAALVEEERVKDASKGIEIAKVLEGFVDRKLVKQTVMTTVYGVTLYGAKLQIIKRLEEIPNYPPQFIPAGSTYMTHKTFLCLKKMFKSARKIQEWFLDCAGEITTKKKDYVQWISPMGLPVLQSYAKIKRDGKGVKYFAPDVMKQKNAFPPNFIHSLDSSHMMLTSLYCEKAGLTFAAVHDCFWTHPCNVDTMNRICREQFISLHSELILENLGHFFKRMYVNGANDRAAAIFESVPEKGSFDLWEVMNSVYFFS